MDYDYTHQATWNSHTRYPDLADFQVTHRLFSVSLDLGFISDFQVNSPVERSSHLEVLGHPNVEF
jgi:hypothetical protein